MNNRSLGGEGEYSSIMNNFFYTQLEPPELERRFRIKTLARDKTQVLAIIALTLIIVAGFIALDLRLLRSGPVLLIRYTFRVAGITIH